MLTFFTIKSYFALAIVTLALHGLGFSFVYATAISAAQVRPVVCTVHLHCTPVLYTCTHISTQNWFPKSKRGLVGSIVLSGYGYGSLIWVPIQVRHNITGSVHLYSPHPDRLREPREREGGARPLLLLQHGERDRGGDGGGRVDIPPQNGIIMDRKTGILSR